MKNILLFILACAGLMSCDAITGKEVARVEINTISNHELSIKETRLDLKKGDNIAFWTDLDMEYEGDLGLVYNIEVVRDTTVLGQMELNALDASIKMMEVKTTFGDKTSWSFNGKIGSLGIDTDGHYTIKAIIRSSDNPTLNLKKADLVIKK